MKILFLLLLWAMLLAVCWPIALLVLVVGPVLLIISVPFRIMGVVLTAGLALVRAILFLPARLLGVGPS